MAIAMANRQKVVKHGNWRGCSPQSTVAESTCLNVHEGAAIYLKDD
jgi:hypothetical protein